MSRTLLVIASVLVFAAEFPAHGVDYSGRDIVDEMLRRHDVPFEHTVERLILREEDGTTTERSLDSFQRSFDDGSYRYLLTFTEPPGVRGVAMLTWEQPAADDDQWLYLPARGAATRIVGSARRSSFMGTDFAMEDLLREQREAHRYERRADVTLDGIAHFVVAAYPTAPELVASTGYDHRLLYVRQRDFFQSRIEYFQRQSGREIKLLEIPKASATAGGALRPDLLVMTNLEDQHSTTLAIEGRELTEDAVPEQVFQLRYLSSRRHMR